MVDQPDKKPVQPDQDHTGQTGSTPPPPDKPALAGWHEPPVPDESSRPMNVEAWFTPEDTRGMRPVSTEDSAQTAEPPPETEAEPASPPAVGGVWYTPLDAQLDALLSGAEDTIVEIHAPRHSPRVIPAPLKSDTQPQEAADTQTQPAADESWLEPATPDGEGAATRVFDTAAQNSEQTPAPDSTSQEPPGAALAAVAVEAEDSAVQQQAAESAKEPPAPGPDPSHFEQVERKVQVLRERFAAGHLTRDQLQNELRNLMILGDDGHWWMLGLESQQWYYYDGHNWIAATPPGYEEHIQGSAVRTETGLQEVPSAEGYYDLADDQQASIAGESDEGEVPLPKRVPQEDPGATLVSPATPFLEPTRASEAQTLAHGRPVDDVSGERIPRPDRADTGFADQTIETNAVAAQATMLGAAMVSSQRQSPATQGQDGIAAVGTGAAQPPAKPKPRLGEFPQPDYSAALGPSRTTGYYVKWGIVFTLVGSMAITLLVLLAMIGYYLIKVDQYAEAVAELSERAANFENTIIYNASGETLAEFQNPNTGSRTEVALNQISPWLIHATVATENETFYTDPGFSILAIVRAVVQNLQAGDTISGASTITQQLARALVLETEFAYQRTAERKIVEIIVASEIKRNYTKNEILQIYLNEIFYGNFAYGIEAAAQNYFDKPASQLNPIEAAFLAGLPQSPAQYDPVVNREAAVARMHEVLRLMTEANGNGCISIQHQDTTEWSVPDGGSLCLRAEPQPDGSVAYYYKTPNTDWVDLFVELARVETKLFTAPSTEFTHPHFVNYVWQQLENTYGPQAIYAAGYRVYTTLDENIQRAAETAVTNNLQRIRNQGYPANNTSAVAIRPSDGAVLAMVGSADYHNEEIKGQVNVAFTAQQPGSTLKPFIYLAAFQPDEQGNYMTPASVIWDVNTDFNGYVPTNYDRLYHGPVTVREALGRSLNIPAVKTLNEIGLLRFTEMITRMGVTFPAGNPVELNAGLPTALGAVDVQLFNLTAAYATLANSGRKVEPYSIVFIEDSKGNAVYEASPRETAQVVSPEYAYLITDILSDEDARAAEFGYNWPMELSNGRPAAVKTGTSNDSRDVWTLGYTPQLTVGIWVGTTDNEPMYNPSGYPTFYLTGYYGAAPLWNEIMEAAHANLPIQPFQPPAGLIQAEVCRDTGAQPSETCIGGRYVEIFANNAPPPGPDRAIFRTLQVDEYSGLLANQSCPDYVVTKTYLVLDDPAAYNWINSTGEGQAWAAQRNLDLPLAQPPTEYCSPNQPRPVVEISYPTDGASVQGVVELRGRVIMPEFNRYEVSYGVSHDPGAFSPPLLVDQNARPDANALLGQFDTQVLQNGPYTIRVTVYDSAGRSVVRDVHITVNNMAPVPPPAPTDMPGDLFPTPTLAPTLTPEGQ